MVSKHKCLTLCAMRIISKRKFQLFNSLYHSVYLECTLFFQNVRFLLPIVCHVLSVENVCNGTSRPVTTD